MARLVSTKWFLDKAHVKKRIDEGTRVALLKAGAMVYRSVQKQFLTGRERKKTTVREIGKFQGLPLYEQRNRTAKPGRITSWKTRRSPRGFMRSLLSFEFDPSTRSVVIGPRLNAWLNTLHERGGSQTQRLFLRRRGRSVPVATITTASGKRGRAYVGTFLSSRTTSRSWLVATSRTRTVRVRASKYQRKGLDKVRNKIAEKFRNSVKGP